MVAESENPGQGTAKNFRAWVFDLTRTVAGRLIWIREEYEPGQQVIILDMVIQFCTEWKRALEQKLDEGRAK